jgi:uncharacterized protein (TIGR03435 family)
MDIQIRGRPVSIRVTMKTTVACLSLALFVLSCSRKAEVTVAAPAAGESSWAKNQKADWENLRTWVPGVNKSFWVTRNSSGGWVRVITANDSFRFLNFNGFPTVDESFWETKPENLDALPPVVIIRPTQYAEFSTVSDHSFSMGVSKIVGHRLSLPVLLWIAYAIDCPRMIFPSNIPAGQFDIMLTLNGNQREALQKAIQYQFGLIGRRETIETNALLLKVKDPKLFALHVCKAGSKKDFTQDFRQGTNFWVWSGFPISALSDFLESTMFLKPIVVQPDLSRRYNIALQWDDNCDLDHLVEHAQREVSDQLTRQGLELVPVREPIEMLAVKNTSQP